MTEQDLIDNGYKHYAAKVQGADCMYQKKFMYDDCAVWYFIDVFKYNLAGDEKLQAEVILFIEPMSAEKEPLRMDVKFPFLDDVLITNLENRVHAMALRHKAAPTPYHV